MKIPALPHSLKFGSPLKNPVDMGKEEDGSGLGMFFKPSRKPSFFTFTPDAKPYHGNLRNRVLIHNGLSKFFETRKERRSGLNWYRHYQMEIDWANVEKDHFRWLGKYHFHDESQVSHLQVAGFRRFFSRYARQ